MIILSRNLFKFFFEKGSRPTQSHSALLVDSMPLRMEERARPGLSTYVPERIYRIGEATIYNGNLLYAIAETTGAFNSSHWQKVFALDSVSYQGLWNASTNDPELASNTGGKGDYFVVGISGSTNLDGITTWAAGDWAIYNGTSWERVINEDGSI